MWGEVCGVVAVRCVGEIRCVCGLRCVGVRCMEYGVCGSGWDVSLYCEVHTCPLYCLFGRK